MRFTTLTLCFLIAGSLFAQHNNRTSRDLEFNFGNPGARSLGFGGAFIGLADDATAPVANPAGMTRTSMRSASFELGFLREDNPIPFQGGQIVQTNLFEFDFNLDESDAPEDFFQVPYLAVVMPKNNWRFGFFAHQQADIERAYTTEDIIICDFSSGFHPDCRNDPNALVVPGSTDVVDIEMINVGGSVAVSVTDRLSFGVSAFWSSMDYLTESESFIGNVDPARVLQSAKGDDDDWGFIGGALWQATDDLSVGVVYKRQPEFDYRAQSFVSVERPDLPAPIDENGVFSVPDSLGIGISVNPLENFTINVDAVRVYYSEVTDNSVNFLDFENIDGDPLIPLIEDITEIHLGFEWIFLNLANPLSLRVGYWLDPYHAPVNPFDDNQILIGQADQVLTRDLFFLNQFEEDENHYSVGLGWTFGLKFQLDVAAEIAEDSREFVASGIYRF